jgi:hypothetical protein
MSEEEQKEKLEKEERQRKWERHFHSLVLTALLAMCGWAAQSLISLREGFVAIKTHTESIDIQLASTYRADMAARDVREAAARLAAIEATNDKQGDKISRIENRVTRLEQRAR